MTTPLNTWISVKDAMPETGTEVIVWNGRTSFHSVMNEYKGKKYFIIPNVTHWMLLSKPTK